MTDDELDRLEAVARATLGEMSDEWIDGMPPSMAHRYIRELDPPTVLALLAELRKLRAMRDSWFLTTSGGG